MQFLCTVCFSILIFEQLGRIHSFFYVSEPENILLFLYRIRMLPELFSGNQGVTKGIWKALAKEWSVSKDSGSTEPIKEKVPRWNWKQKSLYDGFYAVLLRVRRISAKGWTWGQDNFDTLLLQQFYIPSK